MTEREKLYLAINEDRSLLLHAMADLCLEEGNDDEARAWRWLADNRKWPMFNGTVRGWYWEGHRCPAEYSLEHQLPDRITRALKSGEATRPSKGRCYGSPRDAFRAVVAYLTSGKYRPYDEGYVEKF